MIKGTTPTHEFEVDFDTSTIEKVQIVYSQNGNVILTKNVSDCSIKDKIISVDLTQEETLLFSCSSKVDIQIRVRTKNDKVISSDIITINVGKCLNEEVL